MPTIYSVDEYEPVAVDVVLVKETTVLGVTFAAPNVRVFPFDKVNHVDGDPETFRADLDVFGGARYGFASDDALETLRGYET